MYSFARTLRPSPVHVDGGAGGPETVTPAAAAGGAGARSDGKEGAQICRELPSAERWGVTRFDHLDL